MNLSSLSSPVKYSNGWNYYAKNPIFNVILKLNHDATKNLLKIKAIFTWTYYKKILALKYSCFYFALDFVEYTFLEVLRIQLVYKIEGKKELECYSSSTWLFNLDFFFQQLKQQNKTTKKGTLKGIWSITSLTLHKEKVKTNLKGIVG